MDREKEIEEIAAIIDKALQDMAYPFSKGAAYLMIKAGYHKLSADDIVLTKTMQDGSCEGMDDKTLEFFKKHNAAVRKETIKRVCQALYDFCTREDNPWQEIEICKDEVLEYAKQNGIDIEV